MKGPPATVALFCGAFVVLLLPPLTSYFFRLFPLLGEIRLTFVDIFILWVFCMLYAIICHHKGVQLHRSPAAERCPFAAHTPLKAAQGRILPVSCQGYIYPCFTAISPLKAFRKPWRVSVQAWRLSWHGVRASIAFGDKHRLSGMPWNPMLQPFTSRSPAEGVLFLSCICHVFVLVFSASFPLNLGGFRRASAGKVVLCRRSSMMPSSGRYSRPWRSPVQPLPPFIKFGPCI